MTLERHVISQYPLPEHPRAQTVSSSGFLLFEGLLWEAVVVKSPLVSSTVCWMLNKSRTRHQSGHQLFL